MKVTVIGLGYIGLPTAAILSSKNIDVLGVDISPKIVDTINRGEIHIEEPGLSKLIKSSVKSGKLRSSIEPDVSDAFMIAVPTPFIGDGNLGCDLNYVIAAVNKIIPYLRKGNTIIIESTVEPRATEDKIKPIIENAGFVVGEDVYLAHCPERVLPGNILYEIVYNNRIVGGVTPKCTEMATRVYEIFVKGNIIKTEAKTSEMSKLMENTYRDVNIALANELAKICNSLGINVLDVIDMANQHPRVNILTPGPGVGGHCLAVDPYFIYTKEPKLSRIIKTARETNESMPLYVVENVEKILNYDKEKIITVFGVTYKPNVDDLRESPSLKITEILMERGYNIKIYDPHVNNEDYFEFEESLKESNLLLCLVGHDEFKSIELDYVSKLMKTPLIFDVPNIFKNDKNITVVNYGNLHNYL